ncbi:hypothetical protein MUK42_37175 [Musa troglodytarum]|uniref:Uncharacterized protein n=1 Tax=Musa troglodytarum TaxID=320322 RepID=A0A9E7GAT2_9LILI|nr:hypothetical protein MUK42_37175 [Musa troglodytarum]
MAETTRSGEVNKGVTRGTVLADARTFVTELNLPWRETPCSTHSDRGVHFSSPPLLSASV